MELHWEDGAEIRVRTERGEALISANPAGLRSLAGHLLRLAEEPPGSHLHLDCWNALEDDSDALLLERTK